MIRPALCLLSLSLITLSPLTALADSHGHGNEGATKYRQSLMSAVGANMGAIAGIMKNQLALPGHIQNHASQMALAADLVTAAFKDGSPEGATDAKPEIWSDWAHFEEDTAEFKKAAQDLEAAAASGDPAAMGPAMKALGKSCSSCHKQFRKAKEDSYKNK